MRLYQLLRSVKVVKMLTLTLKASDDPLDVTLDRLYESYRRLRRTPMWRACVRGAVAVIEVKRGRDGSHWHAHLHVLLDADYMDHAEIKKQWRRITGDSYIVHISAKHGARTAARYAAKYCSKPAETKDWSPEVMTEYADAIRGRRLLIATGGWYNCTADRRPKEERGIEHLISVRQLCEGHALGLVDCTEALIHLSRCGWLARGVCPLRTEVPNDHPPPSRSESLALLASCCSNAADALVEYALRSDLESIPDSA